MYPTKAYSAASETSPLAGTKSRGAIQPNTTCRSKSYSAASATPTCIPFAASGAKSCPLSTLSFPAMR